MNNFIWRLVIITFTLITTAGIFFFYNEDTKFLDQQTNQQINDLKRLSIHNAKQLQLTEQQRQHSILEMINALESHAEKTSKIASDRFNKQQWMMIIIILLIIAYLSYILLKVIRTSKQMQQSNSRIKSEIAKIQTTFASIGDAVITTNFNGIIDYMNKSAQDLTNYKFDESGNPISIETIFKLFNEDNFLLENPVKKAIREQRVIKNKELVHLQRRGGNQIPIVYTIAPIHDSDNKIIGTIIVFHDTSETHKLTKALSWQATHDALTKLPNRTLLKDKLEMSIGEVSKNNTLLTLFFIDLDGFKPVNDEYGHDQGDKVLKIIAQRLLTIIRNDDLVARLGGDEFVITLLSFSDREEIINALNRVMSTISQPIPVGSANVVLSASIGVTIFPDDYSDADALLRHADQAMYIAKKQGRNQYHFFDVESDQDSILKEKQRQRLEFALKNEEFMLLYQPKVNIRTGEILCFEALIRWNNPQDGIIAPDKFMSLCEENELIINIGDWVFEKALSQLSQWLETGYDFRVAINISPKQFQNPKFISKLDETLARYPQIPADHIELEVLESAALQDTSMVSEVITACHKRGIHVALDDFGTGYASLSYLKQLPADQLKIDKSFIFDMIDDEGDRAIVEGIISLAEIFKREVIAEGVETKEHGVMLLRLGCDIAQGYGISKPLPVEEVLNWYQTWTPDPNWLLWAETPWDIADFPVLIAHNEHFSRINTIIQIVEQNLPDIDDLLIVSHQECRLGQWYYGEGKRKYENLESYKALEVPHREAHDLRAKLLQLHYEGKREEALSLIPEMIKLRDELLDCLNDLQIAIRQQDS